MKPPESMESPRLILRQPVMEDAGAIFEQYARDAEVTRYLVWRPHRYVDETREFLRRCKTVWRDGSAFPWAIVRKKDGRLMGMIEARIDGHAVNLGFVLAKSYWGNGYTPEAVRSVIDWAASEIGLFRVWAVCDIENRPSARVLEKAGMEREGILRRWLVLPNRSDAPRDCYCYAKVW